MLTAGCLPGAVALFGIAQQASYTASAWTPYVLAHANSQLYGWVGFFIMGFSLQQHAPSIERAALFHRLAYVSLGLMGAGIALRFVAEPLTAVDRDVWLPVGVLSGLLQLAAVALFIAVYHWNDFYTYMMFIANKPELQPFAWVLRRTLVDPSLMNQIRNEAANTGMPILPPIGLRMATIIIAMLPILMLYPFLQRFFAKGMLLGAVKE